MEPSPGIPPKAFIIALIIICATTGFVITNRLMQKNVIQYSSLPPSLGIKVPDGATGGKDSVIYNLKVESRFAIDTLAQDSVLKSGPVSNQILFHQNPHFPVWAMLILVMITLASGSFAAFSLQFVYMCRVYSLTGKQVAVVTGFTLLVAVFLGVSNSSGVGYYAPDKVLDDFNILFRSGNILKGIVASTILLTLPAIAVIFAVAVCADNLLKGGLNRDNAIRIARGFENLGRYLQSALYILSTIVVFTVLTSSALKEAIKGTIHIEGFDIFPSEVSYAYGIFFSLFLCVIYIPVFYYLKEQHQQLKTTLIENGELDEENEKILGNLDFNVSAFEHFKTAITILAPLITSFLPENLHFLK